MATQALARWAVALHPQHLSNSVQKAALRSLYNYIGCAIGGSAHPTVTKAVSALSPFFGSPTSTLLGHAGRQKADAQHAALLNGIASHVHDYDDTHLATIIHPTGPVASALLALVQHEHARSGREISGGDLLCALVAGIEASCKIGLAVWPEHYDIGWHITSSTGSVGAAVGVGKLLRLSEEQMAHAIGLAAVQVVGLREMFGSDTKSFHPGRAAQCGLLAALLAENGYTSSLAALEAKRGWANVVAGGGRPRLEEFVGELGREGKWEIESNAFKPFPCGIVCHPIIDGCIMLKKELEGKGLKLEDADGVEAKVHPLVLELTAKREPKDGLEGKFSVFHGGAAGLLHGKAGPAQCTDAAVNDPVVVGIRDKITAVRDETLTADETYLTITFNDGTKLEKHVKHAVGSLEVPMSDEQLTEKFIDQSALVLGHEDAKTASHAAWGIASKNSVADSLQIM